MSDAGLGAALELELVAREGFALPLDVPDCGGGWARMSRPALSLSSCGADTGVLPERTLVPTDGT